VFDIGIHSPAAEKDVIFKDGTLKLYKYMPFNKNTLDAFINEYTWYSSPMSFNDPFDCALVKGIKFKEFFLEKKKILSLTTEYNNLLMWSHYANFHTGICIEYTAYDSNNIEYLRQKGIFGDSPTDRLLIIQNARKVRYEKTSQINKYLDSLPCSDQDLMTLHGEKRADENAEKLYSKLSEALTIKHESWSYENEYRIIHDGQNRSFHPGKTTKIFLGAKMAPQDKLTLSTLINSDTELVCMEFSQNKYELKQRKLNPEIDFKGIGLQLDS